MTDRTKPDFTVSEREVTIPISVVLERTLDPESRWGLPQWTARAVVSGEHATHSPDSVVIHDEDGRTRFLWGGLIVHLYRDGNEGYWYNLLSDQPFLFVVCEGNHGDMEVEPAFVTANQDEATGYMEAERLVLSVPMPAEVCRVVERYVISHYLPEEKKKRRRRDWLSDSDHEKGPARQH